MQALADQSREIRLPLNQVGLNNRISKEISKFEQENQRRPSAEELAQRLDMPLEKVTSALKAFYRTVSVDEPVADGDAKCMADTLANDDVPSTAATLTQESLSKEVDRA